MYTVTEENADTTECVRISRETLGPQHRVVRIANCKSIAQLELTADLSLLESTPSNNNAKAFAEDAENAVSQSPNRPPVLGLIKVFIEDVSDMEVLVSCKILTGCIELYKCHNVSVRIHTPLPTVQVDDSTHVTLIHPMPYHAAADRILHAGCNNLSIRIPKDSTSQTNSTANDNILVETTCNYLADGAVAVGNAPPEEFQFVTTLDPRRGVVSTQPVNPTERSAEVDTKAAASLKAKGNEAFAAGEYAQAVLHYSMAIDKTDATTTPSTDVLFSNRAAALLKLGEHERAAADAQTAIERNPANCKAHFRLGVARHAMGKYREALEVLGKAHQMEPKNEQVKQALQFSQVRMEQEMRKRMEK